MLSRVLLSAASVFEAPSRVEAKSGLPTIDSSTGSPWPPMAPVEIGRDDGNLEAASSRLLSSIASD